MSNLQAEGYFYCYDWRKAGFDLTGTWRNGQTFSALEVLLVPCSSRITLGDGRKVGGDENCFWDLDEYKEYFGQEFNTLVLYNQNKFVSSEYGKTRIEQTSIL